MNWYNKLKEIHANTPIEAIAIRESSHKYGFDELDKRKAFFGSFDSDDCKRLMDYEFDCGYGRTEGPEFTAWTKDLIFFPWQYDGAEGIASVPRHPCDNPTEHIGV